MTTQSETEFRNKLKARHPHGAGVSDLNDLSDIDTLVTTMQPRRNDDSTPLYPRKHLNKTFARRIGKRLSDYNKNLLGNILPQYQYSNEALLNSEKKKKFLEIGFGMGEHLFNQVTLNPDNLYVGAEVYLNGVANFLKLATNVDNFLLWPNDLDQMLADMPGNWLDGIYVLFPDPWHKRKYLKKRLVNKERLEFFKAKLKPGGFIAFASDIEDYFEDVRKLFALDEELKIQNTDFLVPHEGYVTTKYHQKAIREARVARFVQVTYTTSHF